MTEVVTKLSKKKEAAAIDALLAEGNVKQAAVAADMETKSLKGLLKIPAFKKKYRRAQAKAGDKVIARMRQSMDAAHLRLQRIIHDPNTPASVSLKALKLLYELTEKEVVRDIMARLSELELVAKDTKAKRAR